jgi:hypothetical protein
LLRLFSLILETVTITILHASIAKFILCFKKILRADKRADFSALPCPALPLKAEQGRAGADRLPEE